MSTDRFTRADVEAAFKLINSRKPTAEDLKRFVTLNPGIEDRLRAAEFTSAYFSPEAQIFREIDDVVTKHRVPSCYCPPRSHSRHTPSKKRHRK